MTAKAHPRQEPKFWARQDEIFTHWAHIGLAFVVGWVACNASYEVKEIPKLQVQSQQLVQAQRVVIPKLKMEVKTAQTTAEQATMIAAALAGVAETNPNAKRSPFGGNIAIPKPKPAPKGISAVP